MIFVNNARRSNRANSRRIRLKNFKYNALKVAIFLGTLPVLGSAAAHASDIYITAFGAFGATNNVSYSYDGFGVADVITTTVQQDRTSAFGAAVGFQINDYFRAEVEAAHMIMPANSANFALTNAMFQSETLELGGGFKANTVLANIWFDWKNHSQFTPYAGFGAGLGMVSADVPFTNPDAEPGFKLMDGNKTGLALQAGLGVKFALNENLSFDLGYRFKDIRKLQFDTPNDTLTSTTGVFDFKTHSVQLGLTYKF
jgi:opacity protein-like surface antigen